MIRVTQGHEKGIGLEIFIKAYLCLPKSQQSNFKLYCDLESLKSTLDTINLAYRIEKNTLSILSSSLELFECQKELNPTSDSLYAAINEMKEDDILLTLPSSKDQILTKDGESVGGHTELFRKLFPKLEIVMSFVSPKLNVALLTDHIAIGEIENRISSQYFFDHANAAINGFIGIRDIKEVFVAGINPHAGEGGIISKVDPKLSENLPKLQEENKDITVKGLFPGDTILFNNINSQRLFIYPSHDQGLGPFKLLNGLTGINLTLGLPFKRVSVDHGTAFDLFGKNSAGYHGMLYLLNEVIFWK